MSQWVTVALIVLICSVLFSALVTAGAALWLTAGIRQVVPRLDNLEETLKDRAAEVKAATGRLDETLERAVKAFKTGTELIESLEVKGYQEGQLRLLTDQIKAVKDLQETVTILEGTIFDAAKLRGMKGKSTHSTELEEKLAEQQRAERRNEVPDESLMRMGGEV